MKTIRFLIAMAAIPASGLFAQSPEEAVNFLQDETGVGVRAQAMGSVFAAAADDYSALYWNPAGLARLTSTEIAGDLSHLILRNEAHFSQNAMLEDRAFTKFRSLGLAYKFPTERGSFVVAFGYHRFKDYENLVRFSGFNGLSNGLAFDLETDEGVGTYAFDRQVWQTENLLEEGHLGAWSLGFGMDMSENFAIGAAMHFYSGSSRYSLDFVQDDTDDLYSVFPADYDRYELTQEIQSGFGGWGVKAGGLFKMNKNLRVGISAEFPSSLSVKETYSENDALTFDGGTVSTEDLGSGNWEYRIRYPFKLGAGVCLDLDRLCLTGGMEYRDWTQVRFEAPKDLSWTSDYSGLLAENAGFPDRFRATLSVGAGAELRVPGTGLSLRGGYRSVPSPLADAERLLDRTYVSGGIGFDVDANTSLHLTFVRGLWNRTSVDSYTPGGTEERIEAKRLLAGVALRF